MKAIFPIPKSLLTLTTLLCCLCLSACSIPGRPAAEDSDINAPTLLTIADEAVPLAASAVLEPSSPGTVVFSGNGATLDASNATEGYVTAKYSGNTRAKIRVIGGGKTYTYDLRSDGAYEVFPLTCGNGTYQVSIYYNLSGDQYAMALSENISVQLRDSLLPFLYPSQYVNFTTGSQAVAVSNSLVQSGQDELAIITNIYNYVVGNISYDTGKAQQVVAGGLSGYVPNVDSVLQSQKGICFDYAALMTAMLRSQQIPTRMELGYVSGGLYHAWISTYIQDVGWVNGVIQFDGVNWKLMDPTFASSGGGSSEIMSFIGNGSNYQTVYTY